MSTNILYIVHFSSKYSFYLDVFFVYESFCVYDTISLWLYMRAIISLCAVKLVRV